MKKRIYYTLAVLLILILLAEFSLRLFLGFCDAPLYQESDKYEYILQPNQDRHRFGAHVITNSYSQRSEEPDTTKKIVLGLGDSVIFGGTWMDHDSLGTTLFSNETDIQMLNIAAGSWGPDNCAAYLKEHGTFGAKAMVLVCSSHDAFDCMSHVPVVGVWPNYPKEQYTVALYELWDRYLWPRIKYYFCKPVYVDVDPDEEVESKAADQQVVQKSIYFNPGFDQLKAIADSLNIPFTIYLHAEIGEVAQKEYNWMGKLIIKWAKARGVRLINGIEEGENKEMYHDAIHYNEKGHRHMADVMEKYISVGEE